MTRKRLLLCGDATQQLAALHAAAQEKERVATFRSGIHLQALLFAGAQNPQRAQEWHHRLFGFTPTHPGPGQWHQQGEIVTSTIYGLPNKQLQLPHRPGDRQFGLLQMIEDLTVSMQIEEDGLRTRLRWTLTGTP